MNATPQNPPDTTATDPSATATLQLMLHYARRPCPLLAHAITRQLARVSQSCSDGPTLTLHKLADALIPQWQPIAAGNPAHH